MSLAAAIVLSSALLGDLHFDGDAQGRAVLAWSAYRGEAFEMRAVDVVDGRPQGPRALLWSDDSVSDAELSDFDVSPAGQAVACLRERTNDFRRAWRLRITRRAPGGQWSKPILVADPHAWIEGDISCSIADTGQVALAWTGLSDSVERPLFGTVVTPGGVVEPAATITRQLVGHPQTAIGPDGSATIAFGVGRDDRVLQLAQRPPVGPWTTRTITGVSDAALAMDGTGRATLAWGPWSEGGDRYLHTAAAPDFTPALLTTVEPSSSLVELDAGPRGDVLATWVTRTERLNVSLQRPGATFAAPIALGRLRDYGQTTSALAADGTGAVSWYTRKGNVTRKLSADGHWGPPIRAGGQLVAGPGGQVTAAWVTKTKRRRDVVNVGLL